MGELASLVRVLARASLVPLASPGTGEQAASGSARQQVRDIGPGPRLHASKTSGPRRAQPTANHTLPRRTSTLARRHDRNLFWGYANCVRVQDVKSSSPLWGEGCGLVEKARDDDNAKVRGKDLVSVMPSCRRALEAVLARAEAHIAVAFGDRRRFCFGGLVTYPDLMLESLAELTPLLRVLREGDPGDILLLGLSDCFRST